MNPGGDAGYLITAAKIIEVKLSGIVLNVKYMAAFLSFTFLFVILITYNQAEALEDKSQKVVWQLIFLSPYSGCTNYQYQMTDFYDEVTLKYFQLYKFPNTKYQPICMPDIKYSKYKMPGDVDLLILVYDYEIGKKDLNNNDLGGVYVHVGSDKLRNHSIVFCDCPNFRFSDPVWILSHELSHFILYYLGYDKSIVEDKVHSMDKKYDYCTEIQYDNSCSNVKVHLTGDHYFSHVSVMAPYEPAIGKHFTLGQDAKIQISPYIVDMQKEVTKWWLDGKINDTEYAKVLGYSINEQSGIVKLENYSSADKVIVFPDGPDGKEMNETYSDVTKEWNKDKVLTIFDRIPEKLPEEKIFPDWFKSRAQWWVEDKIWDNSEFLSGAKYVLSGNMTVK